jgi:maltose alpha-D-glucosyltransferase/alpha-amylase
MQRPTPSWLNDAVFYQIYPQSFFDNNGDGIGDLPGIIAKLDYIQSLGVTAIWLCPIFDSPFNDAGYDIRDYYKIHPRYGSLEDFQALCRAAHQRGLKVIFDLVIGHCSWENEWFQASCLEDPSPFRDWFIWTNSVWTPAPVGFEVIRGFRPNRSGNPRMGGYLTNFFVSQPAFNFGYAHPDPRYPWQQPTDAPGPLAVREEVKQIIRYWFAQGADGFRADMALSLVKGDLDGHATAAFWQEIRHMLDQEYPEHVMIAEGGNPAIAVGLGGFHIDFCLPWRMPAYNSLFRRSVTNEGGSQTGVDPYGFNVFDSLGHGNICEFMDEFLRHYNAIQDLGFICIPSGNHDLHPRISQGRSRDEILQALLFTFCMPGVPFLYYGDEIGMRTVWGLPGKEGSYDRTGIRTPMQWDASPNAGFSTAPVEKLYLPIDPADDRPTVQAQEGDPTSLLNQVRRLIELRRTHPALQANAEFQALYAERGRMPIVLGRRKVGERLVIAINPTAQAVSTTLELTGASSEAETLFGQPGALVKQGQAWKVSLQPASGGIYRV